MHGWCGKEMGIKAINVLSGLLKSDEKVQCLFVFFNKILYRWWWVIICGNDKISSLQNKTINLIIYIIDIVINKVSSIEFLLWIL